jgi:hypothetical protein
VRVFGIQTAAGVRGAVGPLNQAGSWSLPRRTLRSMPAHSSAPWVVISPRLLVRDAYGRNVRQAPSAPLAGSHTNLYMVVTSLQVFPPSSF